MGGNIVEINSISSYKVIFQVNRYSLVRKNILKKK